MTDREPPRPLPGLAGRLLAGNPFRDEGVAFRWLLAALVAAVTVILVAQIFKAAIALVWALFLLVLFLAGLLRVFIWQLGSPDDDEDRPE